MPVALPYGDHNLAQALEQGAGELVGMQQMGASQLLMAFTMVVPTPVCKHHVRRYEDAWLSRQSSHPDDGIPLAVEAGKKRWRNILYKTRRPTGTSGQRHSMDEGDNAGEPRQQNWRRRRGDCVQAGSTWSVYGPTHSDGRRGRRLQPAKHATCAVQNQKRGGGSS